MTFRSPLLCMICSSPLSIPGDGASADCGGDCRACMAAAGDPDCAAGMALVARDRKAGMDAMTDDWLRAWWLRGGGEFYGPHVETGSMPEASLLPLLRALLAYRRDPATSARLDALDRGIDTISNALDAWKRDGAKPSIDDVMVLLQPLLNLRTGVTQAPKPADA